MTDLIAPDQHFWLFTLLVAAAMLGIVGENKKWYGKISGAIVTITLGALFTSFNIIPSASDVAISVPTYQFVYDYIIPVSIPLLLFSTQIKKIIRYSGKLTVLFLIGSLAVALGAVIAHFVVHLGPNAYKLAGIFVGTYTGGSVNFMSVASSFDFTNNADFATAVVVDNTFTNLYFIGILTLPGLQWVARRFIKYSPSEQPVLVTKSTVSNQVLTDGSIAFTISLALCALAYTLGPWLMSLLDTSIRLEIILLTLLTVLLVNIRPSFFQKIESIAFEIGMLLMYIFLATIGAACDLVTLVQSAGKMIIYAAIILVVHLVVILFAGKWMKMSLEEIVIASIANIGGPSISAPVAAGFGMKQLITPAILVAILGYVIGTLLGVGIGLLLQ